MKRLLLFIVASAFLQINITIEDPKAYTKPFTGRVNHRSASWRIQI